MVKVPLFEAKCIADGGNWVASNRACQGLTQEWCTSVLSEIDLGALGWNSSAQSCYLY